MNPYLWCAVGAALGLIAASMMPVSGLVIRLESMGVGVFGAFIGGEFLSAMLGGKEPGDPFRMSSLALAVGGAVVMLVLLSMMRKAVGPLRPHKLPRKRN